MNLQHQEPPRVSRRSPSPPLNSKHRSMTPPTHQSRRTVAFADQFEQQHNNPPPMVFVRSFFFFDCISIRFIRSFRLRQVMLKFHRIM